MPTTPTGHTTVEAAGRAYLEPKFELIGAAIRVHDGTAAVAVVESIRADGYGDVADAIYASMIESALHRALDDQNLFRELLRIALHGVPRT